jgi:hypothetical protein
MAQAYIYLTVSLLYPLIAPKSAHFYITRTSSGALIPAKRILAVQFRRFGRRVRALAIPYNIPRAYLSLKYGHNEVL